MRCIAVFFLPCYLRVASILPCSGRKIAPDELAAEQAYQDQLIMQAHLSGGQPKPWRTKPDQHAQFERVADKVEGAGAKVCRALGQAYDGCYFYFEVSRKHDINASSDGETVVVDGGMMRFVNGDDELAFVMSHELAHNIMRHIKSQHANTVMGAAIGRALDELAYPYGGVHKAGDFETIGSEAGANSYSISFEKEADYVGIYIMANAGYNIDAAANFHRRMTLQEPNANDFNHTHPINAERYLSMKKTIEEINYKRAHHLPLLPDVPNGT